jgi:hypothetical protein
MDDKQHPHPILRSQILQHPETLGRGSVMEYFELSLHRIDNGIPEREGVLCSLIFVL